MGPIRLRRRRRGGACWPFAHEAAPILGQIDHHAGQGTYRWHLARSTRRARMMISQAHADCSGRRRDRYAGQLRERAPFRSLFGRASLSKKALRHASLSKKALACLHGRHGRSRLEQRPSRPTRCLIAFEPAGCIVARAFFQNLQRFMARTQWPLKGADGFVRARSSGKTGAPFSHLPTGGRAGAR